MSTPDHTAEERARVARQMEKMRAIEARICDSGFTISHVTGRVPLAGKPLPAQANDRPGTALFTDTVIELIRTGTFLGRECTPGHYLTKGWEITKVLGYIPEAPAENASILNVGGGSTLINFYLASLGYEVVSVDKCERDRTLIDNENTVARALGLRLSAHDQDFLAWDSGRRFDYVISICVIEHLPTREMQAAFLRGMVGAARPGGLVLLTFGFGPRATTNPYKNEQDVESHIHANLTDCTILEPFSFSGVWAVSDQHTWGFIAARKSDSDPSHNPRPTPKLPMSETPPRTEQKSDTSIAGSFEASRRGEIFHRVIGQLSGGRYEDLTMVDIACGYNFILERSVKAGARYLGIEAREENIQRGLRRIPENLRQRAEIVRDLCQNAEPAKYGEFDIVLLAGIIYHLSPADNYRVLKNVRHMFRKGLLVDTALTQHEDPARMIRFYLINGVIYGGVINIEHETSVTPDQMEQRLRASYTAETSYVSFLLQRHCLNRMMRHIGYSGVYEYLYHGGFNEVALNFEFSRLEQIGKFRRNIRQLFVVTQPAQGKEHVGPFSDLAVRERDGSLTPAAIDKVYATVLAHFQKAHVSYFSAVDDMAVNVPVQLYPLIVAAALVAHDGDMVSDFRFLKVYLDPCIRQAGHDTRSEALALLCAVLRKHEAEAELVAITTKSFIECFSEFYRTPPAETLADAGSREAFLNTFATGKAAWQKALVQWSTRAAPQSG